MNLQEVFEYLGISGTSDQCNKEYADLLDSRQGGVPIADELVGDQVSGTELCVWDRKKAFINKYKHGVSFEVVSRAFEEPPPPGYDLVDREANSKGREGTKVYMRISSDRYVVIVIEREGSKIRIISAKKYNRKKIRSSKGENFVLEEFEPTPNPISRSLFKSILRATDDQGVVGVSSDDVAVWVDVWNKFVEFELSEEEAYNILTLALDLSDKDAQDFIDDWCVEKKASHLNRLMRW